MPTLARADLPSLAYDFDLGLARPDVGFVFCHGFASVRGGEKATLLRERARALGVSYLSFDARAHGESGGAMRDFTFSGYLDDLADVLAGPGAGLRAYALVGSSLGGAVALYHAARRPERAAACVAVAPGIGFARRFVDVLPEAEREKWRREGVREVRNSWISVDLGWGFVEDGRRYGDEELYARLRTPTLLVHGVRDEVVPVEVSTSFLAGFPERNVDLVLLGAGDHRLSAEKARVQRLLEDFALPRLGIAPSG
jgi:pimeloyl-ACP methyl ester carboxylesterase